MHVELVVDYLGKTDQAIVVRADFGQAVSSVWLPLSQVEYDSDFAQTEVNESIEISVAEWIAFEKGLI